MKTLEESFASPESARPFWLFLRLHHSVNSRTVVHWFYINST